MTHPYRPVPAPVPRAPWWCRVLCSFRLHLVGLDAERGVFVCVHCGGERAPRSRLEREKVALARERAENDAEIADRERWQAEYIAWLADPAGKPEPRPWRPAPRPGKPIWL